ncbi:hypothetical protein [Leptospira borgpetersenii]|nr:hypothetical protein [Leptospira borgpetersenii]EMO63224.1 hypothetical protein LEP1GSC133_2245 [Leptospira borgpetersenii serovar Pomona str. 200901868]ABJ75268.1 Hypothetical protein LBJ_0582 [Leptospira borgpetersenii serovar Hardjo-bovis str. JB197]ABJ79868.1 Hypothetical protein LBL_2498 [Leptospira borgpetersenii serovar Hardjo-bovis str. L550]MBE8350899.1 hypothetical protein [Leptospira borgpetersenii serovar Hardjo-bovis]MBE8361330.1 hypothetical protein [Leptospira borgpetersenii 
MKFLSCLDHKLFVFLHIALIFYCTTVWTKSSVFGKNVPPSTTVNESTPEEEKEETTELKLEDLVSQEDKFTFDYDLEMVHYGKPVQQILIQYFSEIENPPPENLYLSI